MTIYYSICFSLGKAKENLYILMMMLQIKALKKVGMLQDGDVYVCVADEETAAEIQKQQTLKDILLVRVPKPRDALEGMSLKYAFPGLYPCNTETIVYLDLDMMPLRRVNFDVPLGKLIAYPEGPPTHDNYSGGESLDLPAGASGGFFVYKDSPEIRKLFKSIYQRMVEKPQKHYTVDQPYFNHALAQNKDIIGFMNPNTVSFNGNNYMDTANFVNLCGDPGDGSLHLFKMLNFYLMIFP